MFKTLKNKSKTDKNKSNINNNNFENQFELLYKTDIKNENNNKNNILNNINKNSTNNKNNKTNNTKESEIENEFLDDFNIYSDSQKSEEILKKYCTLYKDEEMEMEKHFSNNNKNKNSQENNFGKYAIKPLTFEYQKKKQRREENLKTTGQDWFNMQAPEITPELKEDLKALQLKNIIDPSRFYKKSDSKKLPKFFQVGRIVENIMEGKKYRLKKSEVKNRIAEEILEADLAKKYTIRKFEELQGKRRKLGLKKMKINKYKMKNKKFSGRKEFIFK